MLYVADGIISKVDFLTEADSLGDSDHGTGMSNGFEALKTKISGADFDDLGELFGKCGMGIMMSAGGASGAVFGTLFRGGGASLKGKTELDSAGFAAFLRYGLEAVMKRGGAKPGDKTMIDALAPAAEAAEAGIEKPLDQLINTAYEAARKGSDETGNMIATLGRMKTLGERTLGHPDPGSITMYLILEYMAEFVSGNSPGS